MAHVAITHCNCAGSGQAANYISEASNIFGLDGTITGSSSQAV